MTIVLYWWLDCWRIWLDVDVPLPQPPPRRSAEIVDLARWRDDHPPWGRAA